VILEVLKVQEVLKVLKVHEVLGGTS